MNHFLITVNLMNSTAPINKCLISNSNYSGIENVFQTETMQFVPVRTTIRVPSYLETVWVPIIQYIPMMVPQALFALVLDFEATCWESDTFQLYCENEIIEFSCVLYCLQTRQILSEFQQYVKPTEQPILSDFCKQLTGITQEQVDNGITLDSCLKMFWNWYMCNLYKYGIYCKIPSSFGPINCAFVTWTDTDLGIFLENECCRKNILKPDFFNFWVNIKTIYCYYYGEKCGLKDALNRIGLGFEGKEHSGLWDAKNTARLLGHLVSQNVPIYLNGGQIMNQ